MANNNMANDEMANDEMAKDDMANDDMANVCDLRLGVRPGLGRRLGWSELGEAGGEERGG